MSHEGQTDQWEELIDQLMIFDRPTRQAFRRTLIEIRTLPEVKR